MTSDDHPGRQAGPSRYRGRMDAEQTEETPVDSRVPDVAQAPLGGIPEAASRRVLDRVVPSGGRRAPAGRFQSAL